MLVYDLNKRGRQPIYKFLYKCLRRDIIAGKLRAGEKLPGKRSLAANLGISVNSVLNAYNMLLTEGFIYSKEKMGYFVETLHYRTKNRPKRILQEESVGPSEPKYLLDFKDSRTSLRLFPISVWGRYMREALSLSDNFLYKTVPYNGLPELRKAIAKDLYRNRGMEISPAQIIIGAGTEYLYSRLLQLFSDKSFAMADPCNKQFGKLASSYKVPFHYVPVDESNIRIDLLEESGADIVHVSPANLFPIGKAMPIKRRIELFEWVNKKRGRFIIEDDFDSEFRYGAAYSEPLFNEDISNKVIYMNTFSKTMVPSLRISYMVLPESIMRDYQNTVSFYACTVSSFEQYALARFIAEGDYERHVLRLVSYYRKIRALILSRIKKSSLAAISEIEEYNAGTHFLLWVRTKHSEEDIKKAGEANGLHINLVSEYCDRPWNAQAGVCGLVINYARITEANVDEVLSRLYKILR